MAKKTHHEIGINIFLTFILQFIAFFISRKFLMVFGMQLSGLLKLFAELLMHLELVEAGLVSASAYALYKPLAEKDRGRIDVLVSTIRYLYRRIFLGILLLGILITPFIPHLIKDNLPVLQLYFYWLLFIVSKSFSYTLLQYSILLTADQKFLLVRYIQSGTGFIVALLQIFILWKIQSIALYIALPIVSFFLQLIFYRYFYQKYYSDIIEVEEKDFSILKDLKNLIWHKVAALVVVNTDVILISKFISLEVVAIYGAYKTVNGIVLTLFHITMGTLRPKIGKYIAENTVADSFRFWGQLNILFFGIAFFFASSTYILVDDFISLWLGKEFLLPSVTKIIIYVNLFIDTSRSVTDAFKDGYGFFDDISLPISEALINFVLSILLVQKYGLNGVLLGTVASNILIIYIAKPILVFKRCFKKSILDYSVMYFKNLCLLSILVGISFYLIRYFNGIEVLGWLAWIGKGFSVSSVSLLVSFLVMSLSSTFRGNISSIFKKRMK